MMDDALGDIEPALAAIEAHNVHAMYIKIDRFSPAIRAHPRFQALVKRVGLS